MKTHWSLFNWSFHVRIWETSRETSGHSDFCDITCSLYHYRSITTHGSIFICMSTKNNPSAPIINRQIVFPALERVNATWYKGLNTSSPRVTSANSSCCSVLIETGPRCGSDKNWFCVLLCWLTSTCNLSASSSVQLFVKGDRQTCTEAADRTLARSIHLLAVKIATGVNRCENVYSTNNTERIYIYVNMSENLCIFLTKVQYILSYYWFIFIYSDR